MTIPTPNVAEVAARLTKAQREAVRAVDWDQTPDEVSYVCAFGDLHGCYRHAHATGLAVKAHIEQETGK